MKKIKINVANFSIIEKCNNKYAKAILIFALFLIQAIGYGVAQNIQPLFVFPVSLTIFNDSFTLFLLMFSISTIISSLLQPQIAKLYKKLNTKLLFFLGSIISGTFMILTGLTYFIYQANASKWVYTSYFYIIQIFVQIGCLLFSSLGIPFLINAWFPGKNRGFILGICMTGGSIGNLMWQPVVSIALKSPYLNINGDLGTQWVSCYFIFGFISLIFSSLISILFINNPPNEEIGMHLKKEQFNKETKKFNPGLRRIIRFPAFWLFLLGYSIFAFGMCCFKTQYGSFLQKGLDWYENKNLYFLIGLTGTFYALGCAFGNFFGGLIFSKTNSFFSFFLSGITRFLGIIIFFASILVSWFGLIGALLIGFSCYVNTSGPGFMSVNLFGKRDSLKIVGIISIAYAIGFSISSPIGGIIVGDINQKHDLFGKMSYGNYELLFIVSIVTTTIGFLISIFSILYIQKIGISGIYKYSNNKYKNVMRKYYFKIIFCSWFIWLTNHDFRTQKRYIEKFNLKSQKYCQKKSHKNLIKNQNWFVKKIKLNDEWLNKKLYIINNKIRKISNKKHTNNIWLNHLETLKIKCQKKHKEKYFNITNSYQDLKIFYFNKDLYIQKLISENVFNCFKKQTKNVLVKIDETIDVENFKKEKFNKINNQWKNSSTASIF